MIDYICKECEEEFSFDSTDVWYCPFCGSSNVINIEDDNTELGYCGEESCNPCVKCK